MALSLANVGLPDFMTPHEVTALFSSGATYALLGAFAVLFLILTVIWYRRIPAASSQTAEWFLTAGRNMKSGIVAASIVCTWTWAATLMVSSAKGYQHGIAGPYWYAAGATIPLLLFAVLAIYLKRRAPMAHTFGEFVWHRFGGPSHRLMLCLGLLSCVIVTAMVVMGGAYALRDLTGLDVRLAVLVIPLAFAFYSALGGLRGSIVVEYAQMVILLGIALVLTIWFWSGHGDLGIYERLRALPPREGETYLTMASLAALLFGIVNTIGNFGTVFMDQTYWQRAIAAAPHSAGRSFLIGGLAWFAIPFGVATALGVGGLALGLAVPFPYTDIASTTAAAVFGPLGAWLFLIMLFMAIISTGNAESVAVASLVATDIYKTYVRPQASDGDILRIARGATLTFALLIGPVCLALHTLAIDMEWLYMTMGIFVGAGVIPLALGLLTDRLSGRGAYWATLGGLVVGLVAWTTATYQLEGAITIETLGRMRPITIGNLAVILTSALICGIDCARPHARFRFELLRDAIQSYLAPPISADVARTPPDSPTRLSGRERRLIRWVVGLAILLELIVPGGLYLSGIQFGQELFAVWVILSLVWLLMAAGFIVLLPIKDHYEIEYPEWLGLGLPPVERSGSAAMQDSIGNRLFLSFLTVVLTLGVGATVSLVKLGSIEHLRGVSERITTENALHEDMVYSMIPQALEERSRGEYDGPAAAALSERVKLLAASQYAPSLLRAMISLPEAQGPTSYLSLGEKEREFIAGRIERAYLEHRMANMSQLSQQRRQAIALILISLVGTLTIGLFLTIRTSAIITRPVRRLAEASRRFAAGEPPAPPLPVETTDEIGVLTEEFNAMAARIREQVTALKAAEEEFRLIVSHVNDAIIYLDVEGSIRWGNDQACVLLGRPSEKILGLPIMSVLTPESAQRAEERLAAVRHGESVPPLVELGIVHPDGEVISVEANAASVRKSGKIVGRLLVLRDITERKRAYEQARRLSHILEESLNEIYVFDAETLKFLVVNKGGRVNLGYTMDELLALTPLDLKPEYSPESFAVLIRPLRTGEQHLIRFTTIHRRKDSSTYPVEVHLQLFSITSPPVFVAIILDISERKRAEGAIHALVAGTASVTGEEFFPVFVRQLAAAVETRYAFVTELVGDEQARVRVLAIWMGDRLGTSFEYDLIHTPCKVVFNQGRAYHPESVQEIYPKDKDLVVLGAVGYLGITLADSSGKPIGHVCVLDDKPLREENAITSIMNVFAARAAAELERKHAEEALRESERQLRELLDERERLGQDLHDGIIQTIYAIGLGLVECRQLILEDPREAVRKIGAATADLNLVIRDLRVSIMGHDQELVDGRQLIEALERTIHTIGSHVLTFSLDANRAAVNHLTAEQASHILQIAREAMSNSLRHSKARTGCVSLQTHEGVVHFEVSDDGVGFEPDSLEGPGLGLHNIAARARKLGTKLQVLSKPGHGTRIVVEIPKGSRT